MAIDINSVRQAVERAANAFPDAPPSPIQKAPAAAEPAKKVQ